MKERMQRRVRERKRVGIEHRDEMMLVLVLFLRAMCVNCANTFAGVGEGGGGLGSRRHRCWCLGGGFSMGGC